MKVHLKFINLCVNWIKFLKFVSLVNVCVNWIKFLNFVCLFVGMYIICKEPKQIVCKIVLYLDMKVL